MSLELPFIDLGRHSTTLLIDSDTTEVLIILDVGSCTTLPVELALLRFQSCSDFASYQSSEEFHRLWESTLPESGRCCYQRCSNCETWGQMQGDIREFSLILSEIGSRAVLPDLLIRWLICTPPASSSSRPITLDSS